MQAQREFDTVRVPVVIDEKGVYRVPREPVTLYKGQDVVFEYGGRAGATLFFPVPGVFSCRAVDLEPIVPGAPETAWSTRLTVRRDAPVGEFSYAIYARDVDDFAVAASPPRMNIKDPPKDPGDGD